MQDLAEIINLQTPDRGVLVPNWFPAESSSPRIAIIGEAPGSDETFWCTCRCGHEFPKEYYDYKTRTRITQVQCPQCCGKDFSLTPKPFVGASGRFLTALCIDAGLDRRGFFVGNVAQYRPPKNDINAFPWQGFEIQQGLEQLRQDMAVFQPDLVILLGKTALRAAKGTWKNAKGRDFTYSIDDWRGTVFKSLWVESPFYCKKCIATYHPAYLFRVYENTPLVKFDLRRAKKHSTFKDIPTANLVLDVEPCKDTIIKRLRYIREQHIPIGLDIEGYGSYGKKIVSGGRSIITNGMVCLSISPSAGEAFIIPFVDNNGNNYWSITDEADIWFELSLTLEDINVAKILQNGMYDAFVIAWLYKILVRNIADDTMLKHWELYCELPKSLALQTSIYCDDVPYYKDEGHTNDLKKFWGYCCKDSALTHRINSFLSRALQGPSLAHYRFNMDLVEPFLFIELKGMRVDLDKRDQRVTMLKQLAWFEAKGKRKTSSGQDQLRLEELTGWQVNVNSVVDMKRLVYDQLRMPPQFKERADGTSTLTCDFDTLLHLGKKYHNETLLQCIKVRRIRKHISDLVGTTTDQDGRIRSSTNIVGSKTGRTSSSEAPTGEGTNLQNRRDEDRDLCLADPDSDFCQCDLAGADGWTVAAHCARLGDSTMLDDYLARLKPAKNVALMRLHGEDVNNFDRPTLRKLGKSINAETDKTSNPPYVYYASKRIQHGTNYRMGPAKVVNQIYLDTEGEVDLSEELAKTLQALYLLRYQGVPRWQEWVECELNRVGYLVCASGHKRIFFGRKNDPETINQACSQEPQHNTTWITNEALRKLWQDPENRTSSGLLKIWPCHQIHDALCFQWKRELREWAIERIKHYFNNPVIIAGQQLTIPFEGSIGPSWGEIEMTFEP